MVKKVPSWPRFLSHLSIAYLISSSSGSFVSIATCLMIGRFNEMELKFAISAVLILMIIAGFTQLMLDRRWLKNTRQYLTHKGEVTQEIRNGFYFELIRYPWRGSLMGYIAWQFCVISFVLVRVFALDNIPMYRNIFILSVTFGAAFLNWTVQYFLLRRISYRLLENVQVDNEFAQNVGRRSVTRKYVHATGSMLIGIVIIGGMIAYGLNRNLAMTNLYRQAQNILVTTELLLYEFDFSQEIDIQGKLSEINQNLPGNMEIVSKVSPEAIDVSLLESSKSNWFVFPVYTAELQNLNKQMMFSRSLAFGNNRNSNIYLQYTVNTENLIGELTQAAIKITVLGVLLAIAMMSSTIATTYQLGRPIRIIRKALHPKGETFKAPPLVISDDELMSFSVGIRSMFLRLQDLFQELLKSYWNVKDERAQLNTVATRYQQQINRDRQQIQLVTGRLRELTDHVHGFGEQMEAMSKVSESVNQAVRLLADTISNMQSEMMSVRVRIQDAREWLDSNSDEVSTSNRVMAGLDHWIMEATQDFDLISRRFKDLLLTLEPVEQRLLAFSEHVSLGNTHVQTVFHLLTSETDRYNEGVGLIEGAQDKLDEVMETFEQVESIREQIDMLSFQAAVVASQSIDYERDFRVVADEIRDLSERAAAGIQQVFTAIWALDQQGKQTIQRIVKSRLALSSALETSQRAYDDAQQGLIYSSTFTEDMHNVLQVIRNEANRTESLVKSLREPFTRGSELRGDIEKVTDLYLNVAGQMQRLGEISRLMESRIREQQDALRHAGSSMEKISLQIRDLISAGEGMVAQSRTLRSILERLNQESQQTSERIESTITDLLKIEEDVFRNEVEVKRISAQLQSA